MTAEERDRAAILRLIEQETEAYFNKDFDAWARCWIAGSHSQRWMRFARSGTLVWSGEEYMRRIQSGMGRSPSPNSSVSTVCRENISIHLGGDMAWVTFDQHARSTGDAFDVPGWQHEMRVVERRVGAWRIVFACTVQSSFDYVRSPLLRVDAGGVVLWKNEAATNHLRESPVLFVGAGHLRARSREADRRLQEAIRQAAVANETLPTERLFTRSEVGSVALAGGRGEPATVCWVTADSDMILVAINDETMTAERLRAAAVVYGLSPAQLRIAADVVAGHDLVSVSARMGVSINTARTQLQRMFEKMGVRSQPALVRALFSFPAQSP